MRSNSLQNARQCAGLDGMMIRNYFVVFTVALCGHANVGTFLTRHLIALERLEPLLAEARKYHEAISLSQNFIPYKVQADDLRRQRCIIEVAGNGFFDHST